MLQHQNKSWWQQMIEHIISVILMVIMVLCAALALTILIVLVEEIVVFIEKGRLINTYTNVYGNALGVIGWHFLIIFFIVAYWSLLDVFYPRVPKDKYDVKHYLDLNED